VKLLQLNEEMDALDQLLAEIDGDISDDAVAEYVGQLSEEIGEAFNEKVDAYCALIREKELRVAARKEEAERLQMRARTEQRDIDWLKGTLKYVLQTRGMKKAGNKRTATVCNNGGKTPLDLRVAPDQLPEDYRETVVSYKPNDAAIRTALDEGKELPFASYMDRGTHLRVK